MDTQCFQDQDTTLILEPSKNRIIILKIQCVQFWGNYEREALVPISPANMSFYKFEFCNINWNNIYSGENSGLNPEFFALSGNGICTQTIAVYTLALLLYMVIYKPRGGNGCSLYPFDRTPCSFLAPGPYIYLWIHKIWNSID